jgi:HPt (histidine-containing phosphotransfer) domain-containing protein
MDNKLEEINEHFQSGDALSIYRTAHAIKSMSANIGAEKVRLISSQIELASKANKLSGLNAYIIELDQGYSEFRQAFEEEYIN